MRGKFEILSVLIILLGTCILVSFIDFLRGSSPIIAVHTSPAEGKIFSGSHLTVGYSAKGIPAVRKVQILLTGAINEVIEATAAVSGFHQVSIPASLPGDSKISLQVRIVDPKGDSTTSNSLFFIIKKDRTPPSIRRSSPSSAALEADSGNSFFVAVDAIDNATIDRVEFSFHGNRFVDRSEPYQVDFVAPDVSTDTFFPVSLTAYDVSGNAAHSDFQIRVKPLLSLPGHYVKRYGDNGHEMDPLPAASKAWASWGPVDLKYYSHTLFTVQINTCCGGSVPPGVSLKLAYSPDRESWTPFFSWDLVTHSDGYYDNYFPIPASARNAGPVYIGFITSGGDDRSHNLFYAHLGIQLSGYSKLNPIFRYETLAIPNFPYPKSEKEWPTSHFRLRWDLTYFSRLRFRIYGSNTGPTDAEITMQYFNENAHEWKYVGGDAGTWLRLNDFSNDTGWINLEPQDRSDVCLRFVVRNGDGIVKAANKRAIIELQGDGETSRLLISRSLYADFGNADNTIKWNLPETERALFDRHRSELSAEYRIPSANAAQVRIRTHVVTAGSLNATLRLKFWNGSEWQNFSGDEPQVSLGSTGEKVSKWIDLPAAAKQDSLRIRFFVSGHYVTEFQIPEFEFRGVAEKRTR